MSPDSETLEQKVARLELELSLERARSAAANAEVANLKEQMAKFQARIARYLKEGQ